jgi:hypothetical protein
VAWVRGWPWRSRTGRVEAAAVADAEGDAGGEVEVVEGEAVEHWAEWQGYLK